MRATLIYMEGTQFLKQRYELQKNPEVQAAVKRTKRQKGEVVPQNAEAQIQNYLDRFKEIVERDDDNERARGVAALKKVMRELHVISPDNIPDSYFKLQERIARERGEEYELSDEKKQEAIEVIQQDQKQSLDEWIEYLAGPDALYPDWVKYWAFRSVLSMSKYDKEKHEFVKRSKQTIAPFPDLNQEALAYVVDVIQKKINDEEIENPVREGENEFAEEGKKVTDEEFEQLLSTENFAKYYAFAIEHVTADNSELFKITEGEWRVYKQAERDALESVVEELTESIQGHGTGWCTAGKGTAKNQLEQGDFYVYYSLNALGEPTIPRLAIRMRGEQIAEVRGVAPKQEIDPYIAPVLKEKMKEFGEQGEVYIERAECMKRLTELDEKQKSETPFTQDDLKFLYEFYGTIRGFGYQTDPRVKEIKDTRDWKIDMAAIFGTASENDLAHKLIEYSRVYDLAGHLDEFEELSTELVDTLIEEGYGKRVLEHVTSFKDIDYVDLATKFIDRNEGVSVINNPGIFYALDNVWLGNKLIAARQGMLVADNLELFSGMDRETIAAALIESGQTDVVAHHLSEFPSIEPLAFAKRLIDTGEAGILARYLYDFTTLPAEYAFRLVEAGRSFDVVRNFESFEGLDESALIETIIERKEVYSLAFCINSDRAENPSALVVRLINQGLAENVFKELRWDNPNLDHSQIVEAMLERGEYQILCQHISSMKISQADIAKRLVEAKQGELLAQYIHKFNDINHTEIVEALIESGQARVFIAHTESFHRLDQITMLEKCVDAGYAEDIVARLERDRHSGINEVHRQLSIGGMLIEKGYSDLVFRNLRSFSRVERLMRRLIQDGHQKLVAENIYAIRSSLEEPLSSWFAEELIEAGYAHEVLRHWEMFYSLNPIKITNELKKRGEVALYLSYPERLIDVPTEVVNDILKSTIASGNTDAVAWKLKYMPYNLDPEIAEALIVAGDGWNVVEDIDKFRNLNTQSIADMLIAQRQGYLVSRLPDFETLDHTAVADKLIESNQSSALARNLRGFRGLGYSTAWELVKKGEVLPVLGNLKSFGKR